MQAGEDLGALPALGGWRAQDEIERIARDRGRMLLYDAKGHPLLLFEDSWGMRWVLERETTVTWHDVAP